MLPPALAALHKKQKELKRKKEGKEEGNKKEKRLKKTVKGNKFWSSSYPSLFSRDRPLSFVERDKKG